MKNIFKILEHDFVWELFENKKLIYFPELKDEKIVKIEIEKKSSDWAKETCLARYEIFFGNGNSKIIRGTASLDGVKKNAWRTMRFLYGRGFDAGDSQIAKPLDFIEPLDLLLYEEAPGKPLSLIIRENNENEITSTLKKAAAWLAKLHSLKFKVNELAAAVFLDAEDYKLIFDEIKKQVPDFNNKLMADGKYDFIKNIKNEQISVVHNDFYPGNIIIEGEIVYGIDIEKGGFGFRFIDLAELWGWFEFPEVIWQPLLAREGEQKFQKIFLEYYCFLCGLDYLKTRQVLNKFLAKIYLDQAQNYATLLLKGWIYFNYTEKDDYKRRIEALILKAGEYLA
jgi:aminoglycoside phosphotransferase